MCEIVFQNLLKHISFVMYNPKISIPWVSKCRNEDNWKHFCEKQGK
jgi:hypothetical protein